MSKDTPTLKVLAAKVVLPIYYEVLKIAAYVKYAEK